MTEVQPKKSNLKEEENKMSAVVNLEANRSPFDLHLRWVALLSAIAMISLVFGAIGGFSYSRHLSSESGLQSKNAAVNEIVVSKEQGLLFKSEDGTPLAKLGKAKIGGGASFQLLSSDGKPIVELSELQNAGGVIVSSKNGGYGYLLAQDSAATLTLVGKYGKGVVELTSATKDGGGHLTLSEGSKGYEAVEIGTGENRQKSKGTIIVHGVKGAAWQAP